MRVIREEEFGPKASRIIAALQVANTDGTPRSYDVIAAELQLSPSYVRGFASVYQRKTGIIVRRKKRVREYKE